MTDYAPWSCNYSPMDLSLSNPVVYHIYPRSFYDSNHDGNGDLSGIIAKLDYLELLHIDAIWLTPIYASPKVDMGYDITDYRDIDPMYGTVEDLETLFEEAHKRNIAVLLDIVPCHTSIEHPWFRQHPDWYVWSPVDGPPNNWLSVFGGKAWSRDVISGRWYLHIFYKEQPALNFHNPEVENAMLEVMDFWIRKGADGFRLDAVSFLYTEPDLTDWLPLGELTTTEMNPDLGLWNITPTAMLTKTGEFLGRLRQRFPGKYFVTEANLPISRLKPFVDNADSSFCFEFLSKSAPSAAVLKPMIQEAVATGGMAWCLGNHDLPRLISRWGDKFKFCAAMLLCTLPGAAFLYMGDEIGMTNGPGVDPPIDRNGRDIVRHPMQWTPSGGFSEVEGWMPMHNPADINVEDELKDRHSLLNFYTRVLKLRHEFASSPFQWVESPDTVLAYSRGVAEIRIDFASGVSTLSTPTELVSSPHPLPN